MLLENTHTVLKRKFYLQGCSLLFLIKKERQC